MMTEQQKAIALRMLVDPRLPLEESDILSKTCEQQENRSYHITEERLENLTQFLPDLVAEYRSAERRRKQRAEEALQQKAS
ncbi:hypothetical protein [Geomesophilobacter sediminis]|uniref:Uncharacterized protein n=1 Tax=Geomesophilobacter sediminis TaxID=2798584 RepID=A0A8J7S8Y4_9BACT|nr:hypothetical protein [Geomesophilobacter sediminis]MBJ6726681.1 hypothetical protein [Geomesophilobacter sediminis]